MTTDLIQRAFTFPFQQPNWQSKLLIGVLLYLSSLAIPIVPIILLMGYVAQITRRVIETDEPYLPEWGNWEKLLTDGLRMTGVALVYSLPLWFIIAAAFIGVFAPTVLIAVAEDQYGRSQVPPALALLVVFGFGIGIVLFFVVFVLALVIGVFLPPILAHTIATNQFSAAFDVRGWWPIFRANAGGFIISTLVVWASSIALSFVMQILAATLVLICLLPFLIFPYTVYQLVVMAALYGHDYRMGAQKLPASRSGSA